MKSLIISTMALLGAGALLAADSGANDVKDAAGKLADADNYAWTTTTEGGQFHPGPSHGKTEKGSFTYVDFSVRDNTVQAVIRNGKGALKTENGWQTLDEAAKDNGDGFNRTRFMALRLQSYKNPAEEAADLAGKTKGFTKADGVYSAGLTEEGAKGLLVPFHRQGANPPTVSDAEGSVKFWVKDGVLTKYQYKISGTVNFGGNDRDIERTTTVEIKDVGTTKVTIPDEARNKIS